MFCITILTKHNIVVKDNVQYKNISKNLIQLYSKIWVTGMSLNGFIYFCVCVCEKERERSEQLFNNLMKVIHKGKKKKTMTVL